MTNGSRRLRRNHLWSLLLGALGTACTGDLCAEPLPVNGVQAGNLDDRGLPLRLSRRLGEAGRPKGAGRREPIRPALPEPRLQLDFLVAALSRSDGSGDAQRLVAAPAPVLVRGVGQAVALAPGEVGSGSVPGGSRPAGKGRVATQPASGNPGDERQEPELPLPFDPTPAVPAARPSATNPNRPEAVKGVPRQADLPDLSAETWALAPIRWGGNTSTGANYFDNRDADQKVSSIYNTLNLQANSFIVAPYVATWSGNLGINSADLTSSSKTGPDVKSQSKTTNYGGGVNVFPHSRFPFSASINRNSWEYRSGGTSTPSTSTTIAAQQNYRTEDGRDSFTLGFTRSSLDNESSGTADYQSVSWSTNGGFSTTREFEYEHPLEGTHTLNATLQASSATAGLYDQSFKGFSGSVGHNWVVHEDLNINNSLTIARSDLNTLQGSVLAKNNSTVVLGSTGFTWRPFEEMPLTLTGGGFFSKTQTDNFNQTFDNQNIGGFVNGTYRFSQNLSGAANVSLNSSSVNGTRSTNFAQTASVSYSGDPRRFMDFNYGWGASGGFSSFSTSEYGGGIGAFASANHNLWRPIVLNPNNTLNLNFSQGVSFSSGGADRGTETAASFSNNAGAIWQGKYGQQVTTNLSATVADTISQDARGDSHTVTAILTGGGTFQITTRSALTFNVNLNWSKVDTDYNTVQSLNGLIIDTAAPMKSGSLFLSYTHQSPFSVPNLNYNASLIRTNLIGNNNSVDGSINTSNQDQGSTSFQQMLNYRVGRLSFRLDQLMVDQEGRKTFSIFGSVTRDFDGFFDLRW